MLYTHCKLDSELTDTDMITGLVFMVDGTRYAILVRSFDLIPMRLGFVDWVLGAELNREPEKRDIRGFTAKEAFEAAEFIRARVPYEKPIQISYPPPSQRAPGASLRFVPDYAVAAPVALELGAKGVVSINSDVKVRVSGPTVNVR